MGGGRRWEKELKDGYVCGKSRKGVAFYTISVGRGSAFENVKPLDIPGTWDLPECLENPDWADGRRNAKGSERIGRNDRIID